MSFTTCTTSTAAKLADGAAQRDVYRTMACGIAGLSVATDCLSAIKYARVKPIRDENGLAVDFESTVNIRSTATTTSA
ncbi:pyruvate formate lyase family protein [Escherichia coli]